MYLHKPASKDGVVGAQTEWITDCLWWSPTDESSSFGVVDAAEVMMSKNIVVCCDGTGNEVEGNLSNVLKLFRIAQKNADQRVYYNPGIGTIGSRDPWSRLKQNTKAVFGLATGYGLDTDILGAYRFLCDQYERDDDIFLFGFSRGAYTVRALAGFIHMVGLLPVDQLNINNYALSSYKRASEDDDLSIAWNFSRIAGGRRVTIKFIGVWDTVATVIVPRRDRLIPMLQTLPYTRKNPSVQVFRHAMSIDERRRMFRLNRWTVPQPFIANPFDKTGVPQRQDIKQVWFAGVHADVGGGYPEAESGLSKFPLDWMIEEAKAHGLKINVAMRNHLVRGTRVRAVGTYMSNPILPGNYINRWLGNGDRLSGSLSQRNGRSGSVGTCWDTTFPMGSLGKLKTRSKRQ
jgi:uncharacterized protein (DUF2235 family)